MYINKEIQLSQQTINVDTYYKQIHTVASKSN